MSGWRKKQIMMTQPKEPEQEPVIGTKTWFEDGKVVTQHLTAKDIYKEPEQIPPSAYSNTHQPAVSETHKQEPVALQMDVIVVNLVREGINKHRARELAEHFIKNTTPPYVATPRPQRPSRSDMTWVGLTTDELNMIGDRMRTWNSHSLTDVYVAIEAKLKEKNGYA